MNVKAVTQISIITTLTLTLIIGFQNCGKMKSNAIILNETVTQSPQRGYFKNVNSQIIQPKCISCHGNNFVGLDFTSYSKIMASGSVVANSPTTSTFLSDCKTARMPKAAPALGQDDIALIESWITHGALQNELPVADAGGDQISYVGGSPTIHGTGTDIDGQIYAFLWTQVSGPNTATLTNANTPSLGLGNLVEGTYVFQLMVTDDSGGTGTDSTTVTVNPPVSYAAINTSIFAAKCVGCHNATLSLGTFNLSTYTAISTRVISGDSAGSKLYQRVIDNSMPKSGPLSTTEKNLIRDWIDQGALNN